MKNVFVLIGFDCDRPRGNFINTAEGALMAEDKFLSLTYISKKLDSLKMPRTYFLCGQFLESMISVFGEEAIRKLFTCNTNLVEIADHTYSHSIFKGINKRPDKTPISLEKIVEEFRYNTQLFSGFFKKNMKKRGLRTPLGYYKGLTGNDEIIAALLDEGVLYISSDLRQENDSICPPIIDENGNIRQPYFYTNGLLEIPSHGWHDTAFGGLSKTPLDCQPPSNYEDIIKYYYSIFEEARSLSIARNMDIYLGLVLHPYNVWQYDINKSLFDDFYRFATDLELVFSCYEKAYFNFKEGI